MKVEVGVTNRVAWIADSVRDRLWLHRHLGIRPTDYVLDVGSGAGPNLRANVLCDKYLSDGTERMGQPLQTDRPCVIGDVEHLPFRAEAFDFVICSHVLEHLPNPEKALSELQRIAPRGYIETPSANWEKVQGYPFHRWLVSLEGEELCFREKPGPAWDAELRQWFNELQDSLDVRQKVWFARRRVGVFTSLVWSDSIKYRIMRTDEPISELPSAAIHRNVITQAPPGGRLGGRAVEAWATKRLRRQSDRPWSFVESILRCPDCRGQLAGVDGGYRCTGCDRTFPLEGGRHPVLLPSSGSRSLTTASVIP